MIVRNILGEGNEDKTFITPDTTVEVTDNSGNKKNVRYGDLSDVEKDAVRKRGGSSVGVVPGGKTDLGLVGVVNTTAANYTPTIKIKDDGSGLTIVGTKTALESGLTKELKDYLSDALQYQNLQSENVANIIAELNEDVKSQIERSIVENGVGMEYDKYKDYAHALEVMSATNPMKKTGDKNKIAGYDKEGKLVYKTPQEWIDYYRENYSSTKRSDLFTGAALLMSQAGDESPMDPALWTPYLVMSGGRNGDTPIYGFDAWEKFQAGAAEFMNEASAKLIEGIDRTLLRGVATVRNAHGYIRRDNLKERAKRVVGTGSDITSEDIPWISEEEYNSKIDSIKDKSVRALTKDEKNFLAASLGDFSNQELDDAVRNSETVSDVLGYTSYQKYISARDNLATVEDYDKWVDEQEEALKSGRSWLQSAIDSAAVYAPVSVGAGRFTGTMARFLAESYAIQGLTGGSIALNQIGDGTLAKITDLALKGSKAGSATASNILKALRTPLGHFLGTVVTEIPEDIVQTAVDNVLTGNADENATLLTPDSIAENTLQNLIMRGIFSVGAAGVDWVKYKAALKKAQKASGLAKTVTIDGIFNDGETLKKAADSGRVTGVTSDGKFKVMNDEGIEQILDNTYVLAFRDMDEYPVLQELARKFEGESPETTFEAIDRAKKAVEAGDYSTNVNIRIEPLDVDYELAKTITPERYPGFDIENLDENYNLKYFDALDKTPENAPNGRYSSLRDYYNKNKWEVSVVEMSPRDYLYNSYSNKLDEWDKYEAIQHVAEDPSVAEYAENMKNGDKFPLVSIEYDEDGWLAQEGRHRALAAQRNGIETIPVLVRHPVGTDVMDYLIPSKYTDVTEAFSDYITIKRYTGAADLTTKTRDIYRADPAPSTPEINVEGSYRFVDYPYWATKTDGATTSATIDSKKIVSVNETSYIINESSRIMGDTDKIEAFIKKYGPEKGDILERISEGDIKAVAEYYNRPIVTLDGGSEAGTPIRNYQYFPGVDEDFDKEMSTQLLASTTAQTPAVDASNISMANRVQNAIETQPYNKTPAEIIAAKYTQSGPISDAPNSASVKWETPGVDGVYQDIRHAMADQPTNLNMPEVREWSQKALNTARKHYTDNIAPAFNERYPTPTDQQTFVRNMHYLFDLQKMDKLTLDQAIGKTFVDIDGVELKVSQADVDFYNEVLAPYMKELRDYSMAGLKLDSDALESKMTVGYLPHTSYDPMDMTSEEALQQGNLYKTYSGASASTEDGNFTTTTLGDNLAEEFDIFAKNMIWDSLGDRAIVAKIMSELHADGVEAKAEDVQDMISSQHKIADATSKSSSAKKVSKYLKSDKSDFDWKTFSDEVAENAKKVGATKAINSSYSKVYGSARDGAYTQPKIISVQQTSDIMRKISTPDGDMYHNGGRMVVAGAADAGYMSKRIFDQADEGHINAAEVKQMFVDYLAQDGKRTAKGAEYIADQWMKKISQDANNTGGISRTALTARLNSLVYFEGSSRLKRWVGRADLSNFNDKTINWMDEFLFRQGLLGRQLGDTDLMGGINKAINGLISARMKSLFWLNFKNGVLQSSECVRLFTEFGMGDALKTIQRLSTDGDFRANVSEWVDLIVPENNFSKSAEAIDVLADIAKKSEIVDGDISVGKMTKLEEDSLFKKLDDAAMTPVDMGENAKNFVLMAGILQEAERKGLEGDALFNFVNKKFERIGLANNAMGRLAGADNPAFRLATNLKSFSIRQFNMYINNISDMNGGEAVGYIIKNLGWKLGVAVILAKLGYSVPQSLGIDPFDILNDDYTGVDEEDYNELDKVISGPAGRALLSGGFTSYLADLYWASRQAYEQKISTPADEVDRKFQERGIFELAQPEISFDNMLNIGAGFIPGYTQGKRVIDMAELQASGWAVSASGNLMYAAPDNAFDTATGYIFGRSNTPNARTYYQTADPLQGLVEGGLGGFGQQFFGRGFNLGGGYRNFDPVDKQTYSDWFYGDSRDDQQWNAGYYYFRDLAQTLETEYQNALQQSYDEDSRNAVYNSYNAQLRELDDSIARFVQAYQTKNPGKFDANKMNNILTIMRTYRPDLNADEAQRSEQFFNANDAALQRYTAAGLPQQVSYKYNADDNRTEVEYSPQLRAAMQGRYGLPEEASKIVKQVYNDKWKELNKEYRDKYYNTKSSKEKKAIQAEYFSLVRKDLDPIVALYGAEIFSNDDVDDVMEDVFNSMTPYGTSVKKYLQGKYENYMAGTIQYSQPGNETITEIKSLLDQGKTARGKALARTLLQRVQENRQALTREELEWLQGVLND